MMNIAMQRVRRQVINSNLSVCRIYEFFEHTKLNTFIRGFVHL